MDDSSIHGLAGEGGCLGPAGLWGRPRGGDLASLRASLGPGRRQALGPRNCSVPAGGSSVRVHGPFSQSPPFVVWGDNGTTNTGRVLARLSPKGPAEGDKHRVQSQLPKQHQTSRPQGEQARAPGSQLGAHCWARTRGGRGRDGLITVGGGGGGGGENLQGPGDRVGRRPLIRSRAALEPARPLSQETASPWLAAAGLYRSILKALGDGGTPRVCVPAPPQPR